MKKIVKLGKSAEPNESIRQYYLSLRCQLVGINEYDLSIGLLTSYNCVVSVAHAPCMLIL